MPFPASTKRFIQRLQRLTSPRPTSGVNRSITYDTLFHMGTRIALVVFCSTAVSYLHLKSSLESAMKDQLENYVAERGQRENELFQLAADNHQLLIAPMLEQLGKRDRAVVQDEFNQLLAPWRDGSIRNAPAEQDPKKFDTKTRASVFIGPGTTITPDLEDRITLAANLVQSYGPAWQNRFLNAYISLPENALVNYYPGTPWGLEIPASMKIPEEDWFSFADAKNNPQRQTRWTPPYEDPASRDWMVSSATPVYGADNRLLMLVQQDMSLNSLFQRTINDQFKGTHNIILRRDGKLIAHPQLMDQIKAVYGDFDINKLGDPHLRRILRLIQAQAQGPGVKMATVLDNTVDDEFLAIAKLPGPDWYFVTVYPKSLLAEQAGENTKFVLLIGALALLLEVLLLAYTMRRKVAQPLKQLLAATTKITTGQFDVALEVHRPDELGQLAGAFNTMTEQLQTSFATLEEKIAELERSQLQLVQKEKMSALGQLVAGVAHEINNPVGFIQGNLTYAEQYMTLLIQHLHLYQTAATPAVIAEHAETIELDYVLSDLPGLLSSMSQGTERIQSISTSLRVFSRADSVDAIEFNINENIDSTLLILKHRLKSEGNRPEIIVVREYGELPLMKGYPGQLNQVFMNLLANAIDALGDCFDQWGREHFQGKPPQIRVQTESSDGQIRISIQDNGMGISDEVKAHMFEYLFTTKAVGKGTGIGLALVQQIVVEKHAGAIAVESTVGAGATFNLTLPITPPIGFTPKAMAPALGTGEES
jgi:two-component system, NtrC family, sensor kinase